MRDFQHIRDPQMSFFKIHFVNDKKILIPR